MLVELSIRNFAIIPSLTVSFQKGLNVLTGETGAGKSIMIDALTLLIGGRASVDYIRHGQKKAEIEGLFAIEPDHPGLDILNELGIECEEQTLILRRDISLQGKSVCRINGKMVPLSILRRLGQTLIDIHGQHEYQHLLHEEYHLALLDEYGKTRIGDHKQTYEELYQRYCVVTQTIKELTENEQQMIQRLDLLRFQFDEISRAKLEPNEDDQLIQERKKRAHAQKIREGIEEAYEALHGQGRSLESLGVVMNNLRDLSAYDEELTPAAERVETAYYQLEDVSHLLSRYRDEMDVDPARLNEIESRLMEIEQLKRKYGETVEEILEYAAAIQSELDSIEHREERIEEETAKQEDVIMKMVVEASQLTNVRTDVSSELEADIMDELKGLYMDQTQIKIQLSPLTTGKEIEYDQTRRHIRNDGWDDVQFLISPNPGEPLKSLARIASGGELSRLMLALKSVFSKVDPVDTLVFDEVDTGVSGRVALAMAKKLYALAQSGQVLCITHQPQVAALADHHYRIAKQVSKGETKTEIIPLDKDETQNELTKMMGSMEVSHVTAEHARQLLQSAGELKMQIQEKLSK